MSALPPDPQEPLDLDTYARVSTELDVARGSREEVLARHAVAPTVWERAQLYWSRRLADDAITDGPLGDAFAEALSQAREHLGPLKIATPEEWAALTLDLAERGADTALAARGLLPAEYFRLAKHWATTLARDTSLGARYAKALYAAAAARK